MFNLKTIQRCLLFSLFIIIFLFAKPSKIVFATTYRPLSNAYVANAQIVLLSSAIEIFVEDTGNYPSEEQGLNSLIEKPKNYNIAGWRGPYLNKPEIPEDPWGNSYIYRCPGKHNRKSFDLYSMGMDRISNSNGSDKDDISNWMSEDNWDKYYRPKFPILKVFVFCIVITIIILLITYKKKNITKLLQKIAKHCR